MVMPWEQLGWMRVFNYLSHTEARLNMSAYLRLHEGQLQVMQEALKEYMAARQNNPDLEQIEKHGTAAEILEMIAGTRSDR